MRRRDARAPDVAGPAHDYGSRVMSRRRISDSKIEGRLLYGSTPLQNPAIVNVRRMEWNSTTGRRRCTRKSAASPSKRRCQMAAGGSARRVVDVVNRSQLGRSLGRALASADRQSGRCGRCRSQMMGAAAANAMQAMGRESRVPDPRPVRTEMKKLIR